jgi:hypothetical protein
MVMSAVGCSGCGAGLTPAELEEDLLAVLDLWEEEAVRLRLAAATAAAGAGGAQGAVACGLSRATDWKAIQSSRWLAKVF